MQTTSVPPKGLLSEMQPVSIAEETVKAEPTSPFNCILNKASTCILDSPTDSEKQECQEFIARNQDIYHQVLLTLVVQAKYTIIQSLCKLAILSITFFFYKSKNLYHFRTPESSLI